MALEARALVELAALSNFPTFRPDSNGAAWRLGRARQQQVAVLWQTNGARATTIAPPREPFKWRSFMTTGQLLEGRALLAAGPAQPSGPAEHNER